MGDDENNTKYKARKNNADNTNNQQQDSAQKVAHTAGKGAATYFGGALGGKIYDVASKTKLGQAIEKRAGDAINKNPAMKRASQAADKSGVLDAANKGMDVMGGGTPGTTGTSTGSSSAPKDPSMQREGIKREGLEDKEPSAQNSKKNSLSLGAKNNNSSNENTNDGNSSGSAAVNGFIKKHWKFLLPIAGYAVGFLFIIVAVLGVIGVILGPAQTVIDFFGNAWDNLKTLVGYKSDEEWELEYYETLEKVQAEFNQKYGICIDINLITATLTVNMLNDDYLEEGIDSEDPDGAELTYNHDYRKMTKQIELLANMQIKRTVYGLDKEWTTVNPYNGTEIKYCTNPETESDKVYQTVDEDTVDNFEYEKSSIASLIQEIIAAGAGTPVRSSQTLREIARNDLEVGLFNFLTKKANKERNIEYVLYRPPFLVRLEDEDGNELDPPEVICDKDKITIPEEKKSLSIGELNDMESVYYWNLMDSFIGDYYAEYLPTGSNPPQEGTERYEKINEMIENIYLLYHEMGPGQYCDYSGNVCADETIQATCANGVTVTGEGAGVYDLESYIAGVLQHENAGAGIESMKANAIAARTYVLKRTNFCQNSIENSQNAQTFDPNPGAKAIEAAQATKGLILTYNGSIFLSEYDSYCYQDKDCPDSTCSGGTCTVTYTKQPNGETHQISIPSSPWQNYFIPGGGHAHGMSQLVANYMANQGASYKDILQYFYSDGVKITAMVNSENGEEADLICQENTGTGSQIPPGETYDSFDGEILVEWARKYIGNPYVWGGTSLTNGADCSGFIMTLVKDLFNISLPHSSKAMVNYGTPVASLSEAKAGDLLFYSDENGIHHVAIYSGEGTRIHAWSSKTGIVENAVGKPSHIRRLG